MEQLIDFLAQGAGDYESEADVFHLGFRVGLPRAAALAQITLKLRVLRQGLVGGGLFGWFACNRHIYLNLILLRY
jgi:hypothetical protein